MVTGSPLWAPGVFHGRAPTCVQLRMQGSDTLRRQSGPVDRVLHFLDTVVEGAKKVVSKRNTAPPPKEASMADQVPAPLPSRHRPCESALLKSPFLLSAGLLPARHRHCFHRGSYHLPFQPCYFCTFEKG